MSDEKRKQELADLTWQAECGDAEAQLKLGLCYAKGMGVVRNLLRAAEWYQKAAEQGLPEAQRCLKVLARNGNAESAVGSMTEWYQHAIEKRGVWDSSEWGSCSMEDGQGQEQPQEQDSKDHDHDQQGE